MEISSAELIERMDEILVRLATNKKHSPGWIKSVRLTPDERECDYREAESILNELRKRLSTDIHQPQQSVPDMDLLNCPFCGGKAVFKADNFIHCENVVNCGAQIELGDHGPNTARFSVESWNRRDVKANPKPTFIVVKAHVRYWEDAVIHGQRDTDGSLVPCRKGDIWAPIINLSTGYIKNWNDGVEARIHYKICDAGEYWLSDESGTTFFKWKDDYVPAFLDPEDNGGYGDYIILNIDCYGKIKGWKPLVFHSDEWEDKVAPHKLAKTY